jgi:hypothetical protein
MSTISDASGALSSFYLFGSGRLSLGAGSATGGLFSHDDRTGYIPRSQTLFLGGFTVSMA